MKRPCDQFTDQVTEAVCCRKQETHLTWALLSNKVIIGASQVALVVKNLPANAGDIRDVGSVPGLGRFPAGGHGSPFQYSCLKESHGQRSLAGYGPQGHKESDTTEATQHTACRCQFLYLVLEMGAKDSLHSQAVYSLFSRFHRVRLDPQPGHVPDHVFC